MNTGAMPSLPSTRRPRRCATSRDRQAHHARVRRGCLAPLRTTPVARSGGSGSVRTSPAGLRALPRRLEDLVSDWSGASRSPRSDEAMLSIVEKRSCRLVRSGRGALRAPGAGKRDPQPDLPAAIHPGQPRASPAIVGVASAWLHQERDLPCGSINVARGIGYRHFPNRVHPRMPSESNRRFGPTERAMADQIMAPFR